MAERVVLAPRSSNKLIVRRIEETRPSSNVATGTPSSSRAQRLRQERQAIVNEIQSITDEIRGPIRAEIEAGKREFRSTGNKGRLNRALAEDQRLAEMRQRLRNDRNDLNRRIKIAEGTPTRSRAAIAKAEGRQISTEQSRQRKLLGIKPDADTRGGIDITDVIPGGAAERALLARKSVRAREARRANQTIVTGTPATIQVDGQDVASTEVKLFKEQAAISRLQGENVTSLQSRIPVNGSGNIVSPLPRNKVFNQTGAIRREKVSRFAKGVNYLEIQGKRLTDEGSPLAVFPEFAAGAGGAALSYGAFAKNLIASPINTSKKTAQSARFAVKSIRQDPGGTVRSVGKSIYERPLRFLGESSVDVLGTKGVAVATRNVARVGRNIYVSAGREFVAAENVFDADVLAGKKIFPTSPGPEDALSRFRRQKSGGQFVVQSSAPSPLKGNVVRAGPAGAALKEDPGLYVTPATEGSPYFLKVTKAERDVVPTLNPFADIVKRPTVARVRVADVRRQPKRVISSRGFADVDTFFKTSAQKNTAFITKRFETRQTSEIEAVIPPDTVLNKAVTNGKQYTRVGGYNVPIDDYVAGGARTSNTKRRFNRVRRSSSDLYSIGRKSRSPYPYALASVSRGSVGRSLLSSSSTGGISRSGSSVFLSPLSTSSFSTSMRSTVSRPSVVRSRAPPRSNISYPNITYPQTLPPSSAPSRRGRLKTPNIEGGIFQKPKKTNQKSRKFKTSRSAINLVFGVRGIDPLAGDITGLLPRGRL